MLTNVHLHKSWIPTEFVKIVLKKPLAMLLEISALVTAWLKVKSSMQLARNAYLTAHLSEKLQMQQEQIAYLIVLLEVKLPIVMIMVSVI